MLAWWQNCAPTVKGTILMLTSVLVFSGMLILIRIAGQDISVAMLIVTRQIIMQAVVLIQAGPRSRHILKTTNLRLQIWRAILSLTATLTIYVSFIYLPLALAGAISFSSVLFVTVGAAVFLKEKVEPMSWVATFVGLGGVLLMLSPSQGGDLFFVLVAIVGALTGAAVILTVRVFQPTESIGTVLTYQGLFVLPVLIVPLLLTWKTPTPEEWLLLLVIGILSTLGHWTFVAAFRHAEAARLAPLDFLRLAVLSIVGLIFFNEHLGATLLIGMALVVGATLYTIRTNARISSQSAATQ